MNNLMYYKGYKAEIKYSGPDECFYGRLFCSKDLVTFDGKSVQELKEHFKQAIDDYEYYLGLAQKEFADKVVQTCFIQGDCKIPPMQKMKN